MKINCQISNPSNQTLTALQRQGLQLISWFQGRDVVLAIDLTSSVGLNDEGRLRLRQIIEDSLKPGDTIYVVPFASTVNPLKLKVDPIAETTGIQFYGKSADIERILKLIPFEANETQRNTDIQRAELAIYKELAQLNQCRLSQNLAVKAQSVVWLTDAPLLKPAGISSDIWTETPANSPFRQRDSADSLARQEWIDALSPKVRNLTINNYDLSVVDIPATVQEFCSPAPGGRETCLVNPYLFNQLWLGSLLGLSSLIGATILGIRGFQYWQSLQRVWELKISNDYDPEPQIRYIRHQQRLGIGIDIECPDAEFRGYLKRERNQLFIEPSNADEWPIYYHDHHITQRRLLTGNFISLRCSLRSQREFELTIRISPR